MCYLSRGSKIDSSGMKNVVDGLDNAQETSFDICVIGAGLESETGNQLMN